MIKKNKLLIILIIIIVYTFGWWMFFSTKNDKLEINNKDSIVEYVKNKFKKGDDNKNNNSTEKNDKKDKKEFTEFGNFWIEIHKEGLDIKAPIVNGTQPVDLKKGVGHHSTTSYPSKEGGNVVLSGHRWLFGNNPAYKVFYDIDKLKTGDKVSLFYNGKEYIYKIRSHKTVKDTDVSILKKTDKSQLTFYSCTPKFTAFRRLVYVADLVEVL